MAGFLLQVWLAPGLLAAEPAPASLQVLPRSCVPVRDQPVCVDKVQLRWQAGTEPFCIWQQDANAPLFCDQRQEGEQIVAVPIERTTRFDLITKAGNTVLASAELVVLATTGANKRRRYQHPWSVF